MNLRERILGPKGPIDEAELEPYHEAAHAVVALALGLNVTLLALDGAPFGDTLLEGGRVEIDELYAGKACEPLDPRFRVGGLDGERLALHELDDAPALQIDGGNQHQSRTGMPLPRKYRLRSVTPVSA